MGAVEVYEDPVGTRALPVMAPGRADFEPPFLGAQAILRGLNPYRNDEPDLETPAPRLC